MNFWRLTFLSIVLCCVYGCKSIALFFAGASLPKVETYESSAAKLRKLGVPDSLLVFPKDTTAYWIANRQAKELDLHFFDEKGAKVVFLEPSTCMAPSFSLTKEICERQPIRIDSTITLHQELELFASFNNPDLLNNEKAAYDRVVIIYWYSHNMKYNKTHLKDWVVDLRKSDSPCRVKLILVSLDLIDKVFGNDVRVKL
jgi:hypothetical protein